MAGFLIPRTIPTFAGTPVTALDLDDLRYAQRAIRPPAARIPAKVPTPVGLGNGTPVPDVLYLDITVG